MKTKYLMTIIFGLLLALVVTTIAYAYNSQEPYPNYVGSSTAKAESLGRYTVGDATRYSCDVKSYMSPAVYINVLGWRWQACTNKCIANGNIIDQNFVGAYAPSGSSVSKSITVLRSKLAKPCSGSKIVIAEATHDFNHTGAPLNWIPYTPHNFYP
jgi:hypothetical protein